MWSEEKKNNAKNKNSSYKIVKEVNSQISVGIVPDIRPTPPLELAKEKGLKTEVCNRQRECLTGPPNHLGKKPREVMPRPQRKKEGSNKPYRYAKELSFPISVGMVPVRFVIISLVFVCFLEDFQSSWGSSYK